MGTTRSNVAYKEIISVYSFDGETALSGLPSNAFAFSYLKDGAAYTDAIASSVTDKSNGRYEVSVTLPSTGFWTAFIVVTYANIELETHQININVSDTAGDSLYSSSVSAGSTVQSTVGGIDAGTTVESLSDGSKTVSDILDEILFPPPPRQNPTVTQPSVNLTSSVTGLRVAGSTVTVNFTTSASLGSISASWINPTQDYAGPLTSAEYQHGGSTVALAVSGDTGIANFQAADHVVTLGTNSWTLRGTFSAGSNVPVDNYGDNSGSAFAGGTKTRTRSFQGVYPVFIKNASGSFDQMSLMARNTSTISMSQPFSETTTNRHAIKIPNDMGTSPTFQQWNPLASAYQTTDKFSATAIDETIHGVDIPYTLYEKTGAIGGGDVSGQANYRIIGL